MRHVLIVIFSVALWVGCDKQQLDSPTGNGRANVPLMKPFEGAWKFDLEKTVALWKAQGASESGIKDLIAFSKILSLDMDIRGNVAVLPGGPEGEYMFFSLHPHNQWICGKAWHHEDRHDPGDMSKCYARLELKNSDLHFSTRAAVDSASVNDPDIANPPIVAGSAQTCGADAAPAAQWSPWTTYVFAHK